MMSLTMTLIVLVLGALFVLQTSLSSKDNFSDFNLSPLESGFESLTHSGVLSSPFFTLAALFVFFDMELILLLPGVFYTLGSLSTLSFWLLLLGVIVLTLALEWMMLGLKWSL